MQAYRLNDNVQPLCQLAVRSLSLRGLDAEVRQRYVIRKINLLATAFAFTFLSGLFIKSIDFDLVRSQQIENVKCD